VAEPGVCWGRYNEYYGTQPYQPPVEEEEGNNEEQFFLA
jgi:hypothetical protein